MKKERGMAINEVMSELAFRNHLRKLGEYRDRQTKRRERKEACTEGAVQTSSGSCSKKTCSYYTTDKEACQDDASRNSPGGEIGQPSRQSGLPVHLL